MEPPSPQPLPALRSGRLLERDAELATTDVLVREAAAGGGRFLLIDGDAAERLLQGSATAARPVVAPLSEAGEVAGDVSFAALHGLYWLCVNLPGASTTRAAV